MLQVTENLLKIQSKGPAQGVLLCAHGLNQNPLALGPLLQDLAGRGVESYLFLMPGHRSRDLVEVLSPQDYLADFDQAYRYVAQNSQTLHFLGYSFGGLVGMSRAQQNSFQSVNLVAPALQLRPTSHLVRPLLPFLTKIKSFPLKSPEKNQHYRFHQEGVPTTIYQSFFSIYKEFQVANNIDLNLQGHVFAHPLDELVSSQSLKKWVKEQKGLKFHDLSNKGAMFRGFNHLCFSPETLSPDSYHKLVTTIANQVTGH